MISMIQQAELRIGNYVSNVHAQYGAMFEVKEIHKIRCIYGKSLLVSKYENLKPIELTEENILKLRVIEREDFTPLLFSCQPPGDRQVENQYWSSFIHEDYRLHLTPNYKTEWINDKTPVKSKEIDFWFNWYCEGNKHIPLMSIRTNKLKYIHQLQNLYYALTGQELNIKL